VNQRPGTRPGAKVLASAERPEAPCRNVVVTSGILNFARRLFFKGLTKGVLKA
jgi:hypothetical protein